MKKIIIAVLCGVLFLSSLCACSKVASESEGLQIIAVQFAEYDFARQVTGEKGEVSLLIPPGSESHSYEPTPSDIIKILNADIFVCGGGESEEWIDTVLDSVDNDNLTVIKMTEICEVKEEEIIEGMQEEKSEGDEIEYDEHVWTSPKNAFLIIDAIKDACCKKDNANSDYYQKKAEAYKDEINILDKEFVNTVNNARRAEIIFADRFPMRYFADEYNLTYYAAFPGCSEDAEPSAKTVKFIIDKVKKDNIPVIFTIEFSNKAIANAVKDETGAKILEFHSCHNVTPKDFSDGVTYVSLMKQNLENLKEALNG